MIGCSGQGTTARMKYEGCALLFLKTYDTNDFACATLLAPSTFPQSNVETNCSFSEYSPELSLTLTRGRGEFLIDGLNSSSL